jgi:hypothetical protein
MWIGGGGGSLVSRDIVCTKPVAFPQAYFTFAQLFEGDCIRERIIRNTIRYCNDEQSLDLMIDGFHK